MSRAVKIFGILVATAVAVAMFAAIAFVLVFDPNDYKDRVTTLVQDQTGRELRIPGELGLSVFPWLGIDMGVVEFGNAPGFKSPLFARAERIQIRVALLPLEDIAARVYGIGQTPPGLTTERLLARAEAAYAGEKSRGRSGHWSHDFNRQLCLAEIVVALRRRVRKPP